jgi:ATP-dependent DNA helicase DinG
MSLVLQQAAGRLIRHREDIGVVAILDPRVVTKGYGKKIIRSLPSMPVVESFAPVADFFTEIGGVTPAAAKPALVAVD